VVVCVEPHEGRGTRGVAHAAGPWDRRGETPRSTLVPELEILGERVFRKKEVYIKIFCTQHTLSQQYRAVQRARIQGNMW